MRRLCTSIVYALLLATAGEAVGDPTFVNGLLLPRDRVDATRQPGANGGRFGFFSDLYYDPIREEWWALSDRGPGGGVLDYRRACSGSRSTWTRGRARISEFRVQETIKFTDRTACCRRRPASPVGEPRALNGLNPLRPEQRRRRLGRSFDPEGLVIDPRTGHFLVSDEYGPSVYEFNRGARSSSSSRRRRTWSRRRRGTSNYVADATTAARPTASGARTTAASRASPSRRTARSSSRCCRTRSIERARRRNDGRNGRNVRIVVFDNDRAEPDLRQEHRAVRLPARAAGRRARADHSPPAARPRPPIRARAATSGSPRSSP